MKLPNELVLENKIARQRRVLRMKRRAVRRIQARDAEAVAQAEWKAEWRARRA